MNSNNTNTTAQNLTEVGSKLCNVVINGGGFGGLDTCSDLISNPNLNQNLKTGKRIMVEYVKFPGALAPNQNTSLGRGMSGSLGIQPGEVVRPAVELFSQATVSDETKQSEQTGFSNQAELTTITTIPLIELPAQSQAMPEPISDWWYIILGGIVLLGLFDLYMYERRKKPPKIGMESSVLSSAQVSASAQISSTQQPGNNSK